MQFFLVAVAIARLLLDDDKALHILPAWTACNSLKVFLAAQQSFSAELFVAAQTRERLSSLTAPVTAADTILIPFPLYSSYAYGACDCSDTDCKLAGRDHKERLQRLEDALRRRSQSREWRRAGQLLWIIHHYKLQPALPQTSAAAMRITSFISNTTRLRVGHFELGPAAWRNSPRALQPLHPFVVPYLYHPSALIAGTVVDGVDARTPACVVEATAFVASTLRTAEAELLDFACATFIGRMNHSRPTEPTHDTDAEYDLCTEVPFFGWWQRHRRDATQQWLLGETTTANSSTTGDGDLKSSHHHRSSSSSSSVTGDHGPSLVEWPSFESWLARPLALLMRVDAARQARKPLALWARAQVLSFYHKLQNASHDLSSFSRHAGGGGHLLHVADTPLRPERALEEMRRSRFCLVVEGDTSTTRRFYDALATGCLPIVYSSQWETVGFPTCGGTRTYSDWVYHPKPGDRGVRVLQQMLSDLQAVVADVTELRSWFERVGELQRAFDLRSGGYMGCLLRELAAAPAGRTALIGARVE